MQVKRVVVVGGGIAGLSAAWHLARSGIGQIVLLERESLLCTHASGRNAAIFRPLEADASLASLARRSLELFRELSPTRSLVDDSGLLLLARAADTLSPIARVAQSLGIHYEVERPEQVSVRLRGLTTSGWHGLYSASGGVLDIHGLTETLVRTSRALGVDVRCGSSVLRVRTNDTRVIGVETAEHVLIEADDVILAAGAWNGALAEAAGLPLPLIPVRRHLALLESPAGLPMALPAVWSLDDEVYFRREGQRVLTSPCDETVWNERPPQADVQCLALLAKKLGGIDAGLGRARLVRHWACLRTFAPERRPVIGRDPRVRGLHWLGGLGGFGMTTGVAAGELLAQNFGHPSRASELGPERLLSVREP